eukprot:gene13090-biopygen6493
MRRRRRRPRGKNCDIKENEKFACAGSGARAAPLWCGGCAPRRAAPPQAERAGAGGEAGHGAPACYAGGKLRAEPRLRPICAE